MSLKLHAASPFSIQVYQADASNVVFVVSNTSSASIRLPTSSYAICGVYLPSSTNHWAHWKAAMVGLWLTDDWRYMGTNWFMNTPMRERLALLASTEIKPGHSISVVRKLDSFEADILSTRKVPTTFTFQVSRASAGLYGLSSGDAETTNLIRTNPSQPDRAANRSHAERHWRGADDVRH
jgi:hypothetical protein